MSTRKIKVSVPKSCFHRPHLTQAACEAVLGSVYHKRSASHKAYCTVPKGSCRSSGGKLRKAYSFSRSTTAAPKKKSITKEQCMASPNKYVWIPAKVRSDGVKVRGYGRRRTSQTKLALMHSGY